MNKIYSRLAFTNIKNNKTLYMPYIISGMVMIAMFYVMMFLNNSKGLGKVPDSDVLSEKELEKAGISKEECDGKHKEWVCDFCGSLNNWADNVCSSCGSQKDESDTLYGGEKKSGEEPAEQQHTASSQDKEQLSVWDKIKSFFVKNRKAAAIVTVIIAVLSVMFFPYKKVVTVKSFA